MILLKRIGLGILFTIVAVLVAIFLIYFFRAYGFENWLEVQPSNRIKQTDWLNNFESAAFTCIGIAICAVIFWYVYSYLQYKVKNWKSAGGKLAWFIIGGVLVVVTIGFGANNITSTEDNNIGKILALIAFAFIAALVYWLPTAISSLPTVKYAPLFSKFTARHFGNRLMRWIS